MKRALSQTLMRRFTELEREQEELQVVDEGGDDDVREVIGCIGHHNKRPQSVYQGDQQHSFRKYVHWKQNQKQKSFAERRERQMKASMALDDFIEEQLRYLHARYSRGVVPTRLEDLSKLVMPKWTPPNELAALGWLGDWRPSSILDLLSSLTHSLPSLSESKAAEQVVLKLTRDIRIEEAVIDEEMAEIQANCILHLPIGRANNKGSGGHHVLACIHSEFMKIHSVIMKAQKLRYKVLELIVRKLLSETDAAEFLVAFAGIQDSTHQIARDQRILKGSVCLPTKPLKSS